jgi:hypothetical protein
MDCNPGDIVALICFGAERMLAWGDCREAAESKKECGKVGNKKHYCLIPLCDGSIVQFDGLWNILHYQKVLKEDFATNDTGSRVSIQWFESLVLSLWSMPKIVKRLKRNMIRDLETKVTHKEQLQCDIPP